MNSPLLQCLKDELVARGFSADGAAPNDTMNLDDSYLAVVELADLFETMVARREKVFNSGAVVGMEVAKASFEDVVRAIGAIKAVLGQMVLP